MNQVLIWIILVSCLQGLLAPKVEAESRFLSLDVDGDGQVLAETDGRIVARHLLEFSDESLIDGALASDSGQSTTEEIDARLSELNEYLDIDLDGRKSGLIDGVLILRRLDGRAGEDLIAGVISESSVRQDASEIEAALDRLIAGFWPEQPLVRLPEPPLSNLSYGPATPLYMESLGFSDDGALMLVRTTFLDSGDTKPVQRYAIHVWDLNSQSYLFDLASTLASVNAKEYDARDADLLGGKEDYKIAARYRRKADDSEFIALHINDSIAVGDVIQSFLGLDAEIDIEAYSLIQGGNMLLLQTSHPIFADIQYPDTNDTSDIYALNLLTNQAVRVCELAGAETYSPCFLSDSVSQGEVVSVAFVSASAFVDPSRIDTNSGANGNSDLDRSDLYLWTLESNQLDPTPSFRLISVDIDGQASGRIDPGGRVLLSGDLVFFESDSNLLSSEDGNGVKDTFESSADGISLIVPTGFSELELGSSLSAVGGNGRFVLLMTSSGEVVDNGVQQVLLIDREEGSFRRVSSNPHEADDWVISAELSPDGGKVAFSTNASNLASGVPVTIAGDLYVKIYF